MSIHYLIGLLDGHRQCVALVDSCTGVALPCHTFDSIEDADDFLAWIGERTDRALSQLHRRTFDGLWDQWWESRQAPTETECAPTMRPEATDEPIGYWPTLQAEFEIRCSKGGE